MEDIYDRLIPENEPYYKHTLEGPDDMPAHAKSIITGASINIPITGKPAESRYLAGNLSL
jgi:thiamine phosphate synthase YjbQ (UPF0047 family)